MLSQNVSQPWIDQGPDTPFIFVVHGGEGATTKGESSAFLGHVLAGHGDTKPVGAFGKWSWDGSTLTAEVDTLGQFSLFVYSHNGRVGLSPSILQLLAQGADPTPDDVALAVFHRIGCFVDQDTPFAHIKVLPPGGKLRWSDGKLSVSGERPPAPGAAALNRDQAIEAIIEIPRAAIRRFVRQWQGKVALPLSGGRDSRHILLEMVHQGRKPDACITFHHGGSALSSEALAARAITERAGVRHLLLGRHRPWFRDVARALLTAQLCSDEHWQMMPIHDFLAHQDYATLDGIGGDILTTPGDVRSNHFELSLGTDDLLKARKVAEGHARVISSSGHTGGAAALYSPDLDAAAFDRIASAISEFQDTPDPFQGFLFWTRTRREIGFVSTTIMGGAPMVFCPYLDPEMVELGLSLPYSMTRDCELHDDAMHRAFPEFADIPFAEGFVEEPPGRARLQRLYTLFETCRVAAVATPDSAAATILKTFRSDGLQRFPSSIYWLHHQFVQNMDAGKAARLLALQDKLATNTRTGMGVVSDEFPAA